MLCWCSLWLVVSVRWVLFIFNGWFKVIVFLLGLICGVLLGSFNLCSIFNVWVVNVLFSLIMFILWIFSLVCFSIWWVVGIGLSFIRCGFILVVVMVMICVCGVSFCVVVICLLVIINVVVLLFILEVLFVVIILLVWNGVFNLCNCFSVVFGCRCLLCCIFVIIFFLFFNIIGIIFLVRMFEDCVFVVCCWLCSVKLFWFFCEIFNSLVIFFVVFGMLLVLNCWVMSGFINC